MPMPIELFAKILAVLALAIIAMRLTKWVIDLYKSRRKKPRYESDGNYEGCGIDTQRAMEKLEKNRAADLATAAKVLHFSRLSAFNQLRCEFNGDLRYDFEKWMQMRSITVLECEFDEWSKQFIYKEPMVQMAWEGWLARYIWTTTDPLNSYRSSEPSI